MVVSFSPYVYGVFKLVEVVHQRKVTMIVIKDSVLRPLTPFSEVCLEVDETEVFWILGFGFECLEKFLTFPNSRIG